MKYFIIIEDEPLAANRLKNLLTELFPDIAIKAVLISVTESVEYFNNNSHSAEDVILMDIQLADGLSFEIFNYVEFKSHIIFTTAFDEYAIQAIKVQALDYLLKPIKSSELKKAIQEVENRRIKQISMLETLQAMPNYIQSSRFLVKMGQSLRVLSIDDIAYFYSDSKLSIIVSWDGKRYPYDQSLDKIESQLQLDRFFRVNRKLIAHIKSISEMHVHTKSRLKLQLNPKLDQEIVVSTEKTSLFKKWLSGGH